MKSLFLFSCAFFFAQSAWSIENTQSQPLVSHWEASSKSFVTESGIRWLPVRSARIYVMNTNEDYTAVSLQFGTGDKALPTVSLEVYKNDQAMIRFFSKGRYGVFVRDSSTSGSLFVSGREFKIEFDSNFKNPMITEIKQINALPPIEIESRDLEAYFEALPAKGSKTWIGMFKGHSMNIFSSKDQYEASGILVQVEESRRQWKAFGKKFQPIYEVFYLHEDQGLDSFGALVWARTVKEVSSGAQFYFQAGFGVEHNSVQTHDLQTYFNTVPTAEVGVIINAKSANPISIGIRFLHFSNAGTNKPNYGQNMLLFVVSSKF